MPAAPIAAARPRPRSCCSRLCCHFYHRIKNSLRGWCHRTRHICIVNQPNTHKQHCRVKEERRMYLEALQNFLSIKHNLLLIKHNFLSKIMNIFLLNFQIILFAILLEVSENFKGRFSKLYSKIIILSKEIWQISNVHAAFFFSTAVLYSYGRSHIMWPSMHYVEL